MKLATLKNGTRDGQLVVVSRDLQTAMIAENIAPTLQRVVEDWAFYAPQLLEIYERLNHGRVRHAFGFSPVDCMAPLPRAYRVWWQRPPEPASTGYPAFDVLRGDALLGARDDVAVAALGERLRGSDPLPGARAYAVPGELGVPPIANAVLATSLRASAGVAGVFTDIAPDASPAQAEHTLCLLTLCLRFSSDSMGRAGLHAASHVADFSSESSPASPSDSASDSASASRKPGTRNAWHPYANSAFGPVAVTPDELDPALSPAAIRTRLNVSTNGKAGAVLVDMKNDGEPTAGAPEAASHRTEIARSWGSIAVEAAEGAGLTAGTVIALPGDPPGSTTAALAIGDRVTLDWRDAAGESVFGALEVSLLATDER